jgi:hypothetical protein
LAAQLGFVQRSRDVFGIQSQQATATATAKAQATFDALLARCFMQTVAVEGGSSEVP